MFLAVLIGARYLATGVRQAIEALDAAPDLVADRADGVDALPGRVVELPVLVALAGEDTGRRRRSPW